MRHSILFLIIFSSVSFAQTYREGDLQLPVTDLGQIQRQEKQLPPSIDDVVMKQKDDKTKPGIRLDKKLDKKLGPKNLLDEK
ncbi:MAG TPA: hypothetical protein VNJ01_05250 [Bacteriovoracaceae bacterium]|nr:hypothetical protein [Bacteriovoracaceae bacterium]